MLNPNYYENSKNEGFAFVEILNFPSFSKRLIPLTETAFTGIAHGPIVEAKLKQVFRFTRAQCPHTIEAAYRFPLPGDAAVKEINVTFGNNTIQTRLKKRDKAEKEYEKAKEAGNQAVLLSKEAHDVFTLYISGISPDEDVTVETSFTQIASWEGKNWSLRVPLTTPPRYFRSDERNTGGQNSRPLDTMWDPAHRFTFSLTLPESSNIGSPTNAIAINKTEEGKVVTLEEGSVIPDQDMVLLWNEKKQDTGLNIHIYRDRDEGSLYYLAEVYPPDDHKIEGKPREIILLVDHSGSMHGSKWEAADWSTKKLLNSLTSEDTFNICLFESETYWFKSETVSGNARNVAEAISFLEENTQSGGTNLGMAIEQALMQPSRESVNVARNIIVVTDAQVTDSGRILQMIKKEQTKKNKRRISILCIDSSPNSYLAREISRAGSGITHFLTSNPDELDITTAIDEILKRWAKPVHVGVKLQVLQKNQVLQTLDLGDLPSGIPIWKTGKLSKYKDAPFVFQITDSEGKSISTKEIPYAGTKAGTSSIKRVYGSRIIATLEMLSQQDISLKEIKERLKEAGYDYEIPPSLLKKGPFYPENRGFSNNAIINDLLVKKSLDFQLPSTKTAFVAVRTIEGQKPVETVIVPNALPRGWDTPFSLNLNKPKIISNDLSSSFKSIDSKNKVEFCISLDSSNTSDFKEITKFKKIELPIELNEKTADHIIIYDSRQKDAEPSFTENIMLKGIEAVYSGNISSKQIPGDLFVVIYVDDPVSPAAKVALKDLALNLNRRPLNLKLGKGQLLLIKLELGSKEANSNVLPEKIVLETEGD